MPTGEGAPTRETGSRYARGEGDQAPTGEGASTREKGSSHYDIVLSSLVHIIHITASSVHCLCP